MSSLLLLLCFYLYKQKPLAMTAVCYVRYAKTIYILFDSRYCCLVKRTAIIAHNSLLAFERVEACSDARANRSLWGALNI